MKYLIYIVLLSFLLSCKNEKSSVSVAPLSVEYLDTISQSLAGDSIVLHFQQKGTAKPNILLSNAFGSTVLTPLVFKNQLHFGFPQPFFEKSGICTWELVYNGKSYEKGTIRILPKPTKYPVMETYLGPRSIIAGGNDFSMLVVAPTDTFDNPVLDGSAVLIKKQFKLNRNSKTLLTLNFITHNKFYSPNKVGHLFITANLENAESKEMTSIVHPTLPTDFIITAKRNHTYADGNQIAEISTNLITDTFGNVISDGTLVNFSVNTNQNTFLSGTGTTINGMASIKLLHPSSAIIWNVVAHINGAAKSNTLTLDFEQATFDFKLKTDDKKRLIFVESIQSYMNQLVPDGILILCTLTNAKGERKYQTHVSSKSGEGRIDLSSVMLEPGTYLTSIELMGIKKTIYIHIYDEIHQ